jgi:hypothetical protein
LQDLLALKSRNCGLDPIEITIDVHPGYTNEDSEQPMRLELSKGSIPTLSLFTHALREGQGHGEPRCRGRSN